MEDLIWIGAVAGAGILFLYHMPFQVPKQPQLLKRCGREEIILPGTSLLQAHPHSFFKWVISKMASATTGRTNGWSLASRQQANLVLFYCLLVFFNVATVFY